MYLCLFHVFTYPQLHYSSLCFQFQIEDALLILRKRRVYLLHSFPSSFHLRSATSRSPSRNWCFFTKFYPKIQGKNYSCGNIPLGEITKSKKIEQIFKNCFTKKLFQKFAFSRGKVGFFFPNVGGGGGQLVAHVSSIRLFK